MDSISQEKHIIVSHYPIRLSQFLKLADIVPDGAAAKELIRQQQVWVNDDLETRRGRQLQRNDRVVINAVCYRCG